jgi:hypothetical protein
VQFHLVLDCLNRVLVRVDGVAVREMRVMARYFRFALGQALRRGAVLCGGQFEMLGGEFVVVFQLFHGALLVWGRRALRHDQRSAEVWRRNDRAMTAAYRREPRMTRQDFT